MSKIYTYVVFTSNNARIIKSDKELAFKEPFIVDPSLEKVRGLPPQYWKLENEEIVPMNSFQKTVRDILIQREGAVNTVTYDFDRIKSSKNSKIKLGLILLAAGTIAYFLIKAYFPLKVLHD